MGRGRVQLKRIENKINRQVTDVLQGEEGLLKKVNEISVLCDTEVALIVFSAKGKLFEFSTDDRMDIILERHESYSFSKGQIQVSDAETTTDWTLEYAKLKARFEVLQKNQRHLMGEDLDTATLRDLRNFEQQINSVVKHIRWKKNHLMKVTVSELQRKDKALQEQNNMLHKKLKEKEMMSQQQQLRDYLDLVLFDPTSHLTLPEFQREREPRSCAGGAPAEPAASSLDASHPTTILIASYTFQAILKIIRFAETDFYNL